MVTRRKSNGSLIRLFPVETVTAPWGSKYTLYHDIEGFYWHDEDDDTTHVIWSGTSLPDKARKDLQEYLQTMSELIDFCEQEVTEC